MVFCARRSFGTEVILEEIESLLDAPPRRTPVGSAKGFQNTACSIVMYLHVDSPCRMTEIVLACKETVRYTTGLVINGMMRKSR
jgi:hypothetical protein